MSGIRLKYKEENSTEWPFQDSEYVIINSVINPKWIKQNIQNAPSLIPLCMLQMNEFDVSKQPAKTYFCYFQLRHLDKKINA